MKRRTGGELAQQPGYGGGAAGDPGSLGAGEPEPLTRPESPATRFSVHASERETGVPRDDAQGALEIEFEDDDAAAPLSPAGQSRDLRPAALTALAAAVLGGALLATHSPAAPSTPGPVKSVALVPPDYAAYVVTVAYQGSHVLSTAQRRIEVDLRVTPVAGAKVRIIAYYVSENGVTARADPPPSVTPLPASGTEVRLDLTVTNCATVPIGESMGFVDVVADGPSGVIDRFTILGQRYSDDLTGMLRQLCPGRSNGQDQTTIGVVVAGS